jgi:putative salt-induced outer membrane protein
MRREIFYFILILLSVNLGWGAQNQSAKATPQQQSPWGGKASLGWIANTGNTQTTNLNSNVALYYRRDPWLNHITAEGEWDRDGGNTTAAYYILKGESDYFYEKQHFIFALTNFRQDQFNPYQFILTGASGLGARVINDANIKLDVQAGPGVTYQRIKKSRQEEHQFIGYAGARLSWQINKKVSLNQKITTEAGSPNIYVESNTALNTTLMHHFMMQVSFTAQYNSHLPKANAYKRKLDTKTNLSLIYTFGNGGQGNDYSLF